ncbi:MAG: META domain-containing protein [Saprospiraceae bacterium]|nr:META domain-containing protein [Saprospiraceae bacterium]
MQLKNLSCAAACTVILALLAGCASEANKQHEAAAPAPTALAPANQTPAPAEPNFKGIGTEPFWNIEIDFEKAMRFKTMEGQEISTPVPTPNGKSDGTLVYNAQTESGTLKVTLKKQKCSDGMSDEVYDYTVEVDALGKTWKGCGTYLSGSLASVWTLKTLNGKAPAAGAFMKGKLPTLSVNATEGSYSGSDGCNVGGGKVKVGAGEIKFEPGISTMMACPGDGPKTYQQALYSATTYTLDGTTLTLKAGDKEVLVFGL